MKLILRLSRQFICTVIIGRENFQFGMLDQQLFARSLGKYKSKQTTNRDNSSPSSTSSNSSIRNHWIGISTFVAVFLIKCLGNNNK